MKIDVAVCIEIVIESVGKTDASISDVGVEDTLTDGQRYR